MVFYRIERISRILRYQADAGPAEGIKTLSGPLAYLLTVEHDFSRITPCVVGQQTDDRLRRGRFAGAGFTDKRQHFPPTEREANVMHYLPPLARGTVAKGQVFYREYGHFRPPLNCWLIRLVASTTAMTTTPGKVVNHQAVER